VRATPITTAIVFVLTGLLVGPDGMDVVDLDVAPFRALITLTLTVVLFRDAVSIDVRPIIREIGLPTRLLLVGLPLTIVAGTVAALATIGGLDVWSAAALATILAPTDAALGAAIVSDTRIPSRIREGLNVESGLNDGLCVPLLALFLAAAAQESGAGDALVPHVVFELGIAALAGIAVGAVGAVAVVRASAAGWAEPGWLRLTTFAIPLAAFGLVTALGGSGFIGSFLAGITFGSVGGQEARRLTEFTDQTAEFLTASTLLLFGALILGPSLSSIDATIVVYAVLSLTVVRMVPVAIAMIGSRARPQTVAFIGWFGPRGLASIVFALILLEPSTIPGASTMFLAAVVTVGLSVFAHGLTSHPGASAYARWFATHPRPGELMESVPVAIPADRRLV
jgi:NhaP-type Na+/H+ or K+/H+ antiporter